MAKRMATGLAFRFPVSFQAIAWLNALLVSGTGKYIGGCWLFWVCCRVVGSVW
jgi:hypothetical protein